MVYSMTGFGRSELVDDNHKITVESKSVNSRFLDLSIKMPRRFNRLESRIRTVLGDYAKRGKIDMYITYEDYGEESLTLKYNAALAAEYVSYMDEMSRVFNIPNDITASGLARFPEVFTMEQNEEDDEQLWSDLEQVLRRAGEAFNGQRAAEGEHLKNDILGKLDAMEADVDYIEERSPETMSEYQTRLTEKIKETISNLNIDESRILQEVTIYADKVCVDEETVRLRSHIGGMRKTIVSEDPEGIGRKLDFIAQEMNREANTTLSKCSNMDISEAAVRLKTAIEKIREQVQNIE